MDKTFTLRTSHQCLPQRSQSLSTLKKKEVFHFDLEKIKTFFEKFTTVDQRLIYKEALLKVVDRTSSHIQVDLEHVAAVKTFDNSLKMMIHFAKRLKTILVDSTICFIKS